MSTISDTTTTLENEGMLTINLSDMAEKASGVWPAGWYPAEVIEGYTAGSYQFLTETKVSRKRDSFNSVICFRVTNGTETRSMFAQINYRPTDFQSERIATVQALRKEFAGQKGKWAGYEDEQRSSLALNQLGQFQKATKLQVQMTTEGKIVPTNFIGTKPFVHLKIDQESGYNEINGFSPYENGVEPRAKKSRK